MTIRQIRITIGALLWIAAFSWVGVRYGSFWFGESSQGGKALTRFVFQPSETCELNFHQSFVVRIGDPIFFEDETGRLIQVGAIRQVDDSESQVYRPVYCDWASATFFSSAPELGEGDYLTYHETPASMDWVARFLFPPERREHIARLVTDVYIEHSAEILAELMPILQEAWAEASVIVRDELLKSIANNEAAFKQLAARYETEFVAGELLPLLSNEIWPIVTREARPVIVDVGEQIWQQASVFRFGWRALYDASPLPDRNLTQAEFNRFVDREAMPIISNNLPRFLETQQAILEQVIGNPQVQEVVLGILKDVSEDPELQAIVLQVVRESILENRRLQEALLKIWNRPDMQELLALTDRRLEPTVVQIGEEVFGSPYSGVTPEFARILRNKILLKDQRWFILHKGQAGAVAHPAVVESSRPGTLVVVEGSSTMENPFYYPAKER